MAYKPRSEAAKEKRRIYERGRYSPEKEKLRVRPQYHKKKIAEYALKYATTVQGRANRMLAGSRRRAKEKGVDFSITMEMVVDALNVGKCQQTGMTFVMSEGANPFAPSIDRIDSTKGYTPENVQYVCCAYNMGKQHMSDEMFKYFIICAGKFILGT